MCEIDLIYILASYWKHLENFISLGYFVLDLLSVS